MLKENPHLSLQELACDSQSYCHSVCHMVKSLRASPESLSRGASLALLAQWAARGTGKPLVLLHVPHSCIRSLVILISSHSLILYSRVEPGLASSVLISLPSS